MSTPERETHIPDVTHVIKCSQSAPPFWCPLTCFAPQIPEYCRVLEESEISEHCFDLIFAFDEIVALGYRENVNLAQIRTFTEMDSHEEKVFRAVREVRPSCGAR